MSATMLSKPLLHASFACLLLLSLVSPTSTSAVDTFQASATKTIELVGRVLEEGEEEEMTDAEIKAEKEREEEEREEELEHLLSPEALNLVIFLMLSFLICLSVIFHVLKDEIMDGATEAMKPILVCLFSELTVLGFLSLVSFAIMNSPIVGIVAEAAVGEGGDEFIKETFEQVHMTLFLVMVIFIGIVLGMLQLGTKTAAHWAGASKDVIGNPDLVRSNYKKMHESNKKKLPKLKDLVNDKGDPVDYDTVKHRMEFLSLRTEFINPRDQWNEPLPPDFPYHLYLSMLLGESIAEIVEVPLTTWATLEILSCVYVAGYCMLGWSKEASLFLWLVLGFGIAFTCYLVDKKIVSVRAAMVDKKYYTFLDEPDVEPVEQSTEGAKIDLLSSDAPRSDAPPQTKEVKSAAKPKFLNNVPRPRSAFWKPILGEEMPNPQEMLFWFDKRGPEFVWFLVRLMMLLTAIYASLLLLHMFAMSQEILSWYGATLYFCLSIIPLYCFYYYMPLIIRRGVHVSNIEMMKNPEMIEEILIKMRAKKTDRARRLLEGMRTWSTMQRVKKQAAAEGGKSYKELLPAEKYEDIHIRVINITNSDPELNMDAGMLITLMAGIGRNMTVEVAERMVKELRYGEDEEGVDGMVSEEEFVRWYAMDGDPAFRNIEPQKLVNEFFGTNAKGRELTAADFTAAVATFAELDEEDVTALINDIDDDKGGTISIDELSEFVEKFASD